MTGIKGSARLAAVALCLTGCAHQSDNTVVAVEGSREEQINNDVKGFAAGVGVAVVTAPIWVPACFLTAGIICPA